MKWYLWAVAAAVLALFISCGGEIEDEDEQERLEVNVIAGFDPQYSYRRLGEWAPLTVELKNNGPAIEGDFLVRFKDGTQRYRVPVELAPQRQTRISLPVHTPNLLDELEFYIETRSETIPIELVTLGVTLNETHRIIALMSEERGDHNYMAQDPESDELIVRRVFYTAPDLLPKTWPGYRSLDVLMWDGGPDVPLTANQQEALDTWIQMGGVLVIAAGERWQELSNSAFRLYSPLNLEGSRVIEKGTRLSGPQNEAQPQLRRQLVAATGELLPDEDITVKLFAGAEPFVVERRWGAGRIVFVASALDEPLFADPALQETFLRYITDAPQPVNPEVLARMDPFISQFLQWSFQAELPSTLFIGMYLALYIILVAPVNYLIFRRIGRLEWAWFTVPVWAIVFAVGVYYIGALRQQNQVAVNQISVIEARSGGPVGAAATYSAVYSPVRSWYDIVFSDPVAFPLLPYVNDPRRGGASALSDELLNVYIDPAETEIRDFLIQHWSQRVFKAVHAMPVGEGVDLDFKWQDGALTGSVANNTGKTLERVSLNAPPYTYRWDVIEPGESAEIDADERRESIHDQQQANMYYRGNEFKQYQDDAAGMVGAELMPMYINEFNSRHELDGLGVLTAVIRDTQLPFEIDGQAVEPDGDSLLCVLFPVDVASQGDVILNSMQWRISQLFNQGQMRGGFGMPQQQMIDIPNGSRQTFDLRSMTPLEGGAIEELVMRMTYQDPNGLEASRIPALSDGQGGIKPEYELHLKDYQANSYHPLSEITDERGRVTEPERFVDMRRSIISCMMQAPQETYRRFMLQNLDMRLHVGFERVSDRFFLGRPITAPISSDNSGFVSEPIDG